MALVTGEDNTTRKTSGNGTSDKLDKANYSMLTAGEKSQEMDSLCSRPKKQGNKKYKQLNLHTGP